MIKKPTCFKNPNKPTCFDLTNKPNYFQHSNVFETGLSDFHLLNVTEFKMGFQKLPPKIVNYRDYKNFHNEKFRSNISKFDFDASDLEGFKNTIFCIFSYHAPIKKIYIRAKEAPFMTKELHKAIMKRSKVRNKFLKSKTLSDRKAYTSQRNFCKKLLRNTKRTYFNNLDIKKVTVTKHFGKLLFRCFQTNSREMRKMKLSQLIVNWVKFLVTFFEKHSRNLKLQVFQILRTMKVMTHWKKHSAISKITPVL